MFGVNPLKMLKGAIPFFLEKLPESGKLFIAKTGATSPEFIDKILDGNADKNDLIRVGTNTLVAIEPYLYSMFDLLEKEAHENKIIIGFKRDLEHEIVKVSFIDEATGVVLFEMALESIPMFVNQFIANQNENKTD